jgi:DNA-binding SARP family transcriptional activator/TolB-like protein
MLRPRPHEYESKGCRMNRPRLRIQCLGGFRAWDGQRREIHVPGQKAQALLAFLSLEPDRPVHRQELAELLWSGRFRPQSRQSLRQCLCKLSAALAGEAGEALIVTGQYVRVRHELMAIDTVQAGLDLCAGKLHDAATALTAGPFLQNSTLNERPYAEWLQIKRDEHRALAYSAVSRLLQENDYAPDRAIALVRRLVALDPLREDAQQLLIQLYDEAGRRSEAVAQFNMLVGRLRSAIGAEPGPETLALQELWPASTKAKVDYSTAPKRLTSRVAVLPTIAVLPFSNHAGNPGSQQFSAGVTDDLITELSRFRWLAVRPQAPGHGTELTGVRYVLTGAVRSIGSVFRVSVKLADTPEQRHLWSEHYDIDINATPTQIDRLTWDIVRAVEPSLTAAEWRRAHRKPSDQLDGWDHYSRGSWHLFHFSRADIVAAQESFLRAIDLDPGFSSPYVGFAYACRLSLILDYTSSPERTVEDGLQAARHAVFLDDQDFFAHSVLGRLYMIAREHDLAASETRIAVERNPHSAQAHFGLGLALTMGGDPKHAMGPLTRAVRLSPNDPNLSSFASVLSTTHILRHEYPKAFNWARIATRQPAANFIGQMHLAAALGLLGRKTAASEAHRKLLKMKPDFSLDYVVRTWPFKHKSDTARLMRGLQMAGISH